MILFRLTKSTIVTCSFQKYSHRQPNHHDQFRERYSVQGVRIHQASANQTNLLCMPTS